MSKVVLSTALTLIFSQLMGCGLLTVMGGADDEPVPLGLLYSKVQWTDKASPNIAQEEDDREDIRRGVSESTGILGLISFGDATVDAAAKQGMINEIYHIDHEFMSILGLFNTYRTIVYGVKEKKQTPKPEDVTTNQTE